MAKNQDNLVEYTANIRKIPGIGQATAETLAGIGYKNVDSLANEKIEILLDKYEKFGLKISGRNAGKIIGYAQIYMDKRNKWINNISELLDIPLKSAENLFDDGYESFNELNDITNKKLKESYGVSYPKDFKDRLSFLVECEDGEEDDSILEEAEEDTISNIDRFYEHHYEPAARKSISALMDMNCAFSAGNIIDLKTLRDYVEDIVSPLVKFYSSLYGNEVIDFKRRHIQEQIEIETEGKYLFSKSDAITDLEGHVLDFGDWPDSVHGFIEIYNACKDLNCTKYFPVDLAVLIDVASDEMEVQTIVDSLNEIVLSIADEDLPYEDNGIAGIDKLLDYRDYYGVKNVQELSILMQFRDSLLPYGIQNGEAIDFAKKMYCLGIKTIDNLKEANPDVIKSVKSVDKRTVNKFYSKLNKEK